MYKALLKKCKAYGIANNIFQLCHWKGTAQDKEMQGLLKKKDIESQRDLVPFLLFVLFSICVYEMGNNLKT